MEDKTLAVLIDADNISAASAEAIFKKVCSLGEPIIRRAYGMVNCFSGDGGWNLALREYGIAARPQISNVAGKNVADIALVIDAMEFLYKSPCDGICIVSSDSDFTALASKIREVGKAVYGMGEAKTPASFRVSCTRFFEIPTHAKCASEKSTGVKVDAPAICPRCGGKLTASWTKSNKPCKTCAGCGGMSAKLITLQKSFTQESLAQLKETAHLHEQAGCVCPDCGQSMSILKMTVGKRQIEIDVCGKCLTVWYDKDEFESLVPNDGLLQATVSAGKAYRRELVLALTSDLRNGRRKVTDLGSLKATLKHVYHTPTPDVLPVVNMLMCQKVIKVDKKTGAVGIIPK